ncbi:aminotransferase class V-fold PLP-dependent enzyme [Lacihabitans soyangensis]|uniref:phosphoserine transaminase n=1 Tax=Lacihabitans soyangensis TaxID=869394 RepID=A0AAE3H427_9BACT|nr:aminotransferase class V-fold PLP-dependent enzyme [Lacihabitans soyangensis]MCP9764764.1 aminotransferase class V-fold PLP-dependent enzyme [Lacihabitans soyangensis]
MSRAQVYFTAGPAELYPKFEEYLQEFVDLQIGSISHRSGQFKKIYQHTDEQLRILMNIPEENAIMFTGSASEIWEKLVLSTVEHESFHLVNGSFSAKFYQYAQMLQKHATNFEKPLGQGFSYGEIAVPEFAELICTTQNETSTGLQMREADIHKLKRSNNDKLIAVDMVSSAPIPNLDFTVVDTAFFSVQKSFGMPAGLGVWIANERCLEKAKQLKSNGINIGAHHDLPTLWKFAKEFQNPATPNVMGIFILGKIAEDMNKIGIEKIRKETDEKAKKLYKYFENKAGYSLSVNESELRSRTVAVINTEKPSSEIINYLKGKNMVIGSGYGPGKDSQIRISNFIANSAEQIDNLLKEVEKF